MIATWGRRKIFLAIGFSVLFLLAAPNCGAQGCNPATYAFEDRVVFFTCGKTGTPELDVVLLDDAGPLKVAGRTSLSTARAFDTASHDKNRVILLRWDRLEIYDLKDPAHPSLAASFEIKHQASSPGYERIEKTAENSFQVLSSFGAAELSTEGDTAHWTLKDIPVTPEIKKKMVDRPPESRFTIETDDRVLVRESAQFRYELFWKDKVSTGQALHRQYLRKVDKNTGRAVSAMRLGENLETID